MFDIIIYFFFFKQPFHCEVEDKIGVNCLSRGQVTCRVRLDRGGYVPGESIKINAHIENNSKVTIRRTRAILKEVNSSSKSIRETFAQFFFLFLLQTIQYTAKNKLIKSQSRDLASLEKGKIVPKASDQWRGELLYIPPLPPTNLRGCHLIKIQYDVYVCNLYFFIFIFFFNLLNFFFLPFMILVYSRRKRKQVN